MTSKSERKRLEIQQETRSKLKFLHLRAKLGTGATTIGYWIDADARKVYYTVARCRDGENFCRRIGRDIATGRMATGKELKEFTFADQAEIMKHFEQYHPDHMVVVADGASCGPTMIPRKRTTNVQAEIVGC